MAFLAALPEVASIGGAEAAGAGAAAEGGGAAAGGGVRGMLGKFGLNALGSGVGSRAGGHGQPGQSSDPETYAPRKSVSSQYSAVLQPGQFH